MWAIRAAGVAQFRVLRGRLLSSVATAASRSAVWTARAPFGSSARVGNQADGLDQVVHATGNGFRVRHLIPCGSWRHPPWQPLTDTENRPAGIRHCRQRA